MKTKITTREFVIGAVHERPWITRSELRKLYEEAIKRDAIVLPLCLDQAINDLIVQGALVEHEDGTLLVNYETTSRWLAEEKAMMVRELLGWLL